MLRRTVGRFRHRPGRRALQPGSALPGAGDVVTVVGLGSEETPASVVARLGDTRSLAQIHMNRRWRLTDVLKRFQVGAGVDALEVDSGRRLGMAHRTRIHSYR